MGFSISGIKSFFKLLFTTLIIFSKSKYFFTIKI
ncbi:unnamed protein product [Spirodela intermedia]|uniref:Uncharacterized protein n=1 Tax=Spirodela intermedia TaxID=51605 RepID=A0A7I8L583_SPIIN|nr:unnamed protein product [Spirodela intermedia]